jgi:hypothetical protein
MEVEQRYVIKFFTDQGMQGMEIIRRINEHYGDNALSRSTIYSWIAEVKRGRTDLSNIGSPGRTPDEGLAGVIATRHERDPHLSARKLAQSLGIAASTVCHYLSDVLGMKCFQMRWVPHTLSALQKAKRAEYSRDMLHTLATHESTGFHFLFTGDESWMFYSYHQHTMWVASWEDVDEVERLSHYHKKTMLTAFFNGTGEFMIDILPEGAKMNTAYFADKVIDKLAEACYPNGRPPHARKVMLHFDNAPIHCTDMVRDRLVLRELDRMKHPPYGPDLAPCDFFLFGYLKEKLADAQYETPEELFFEVGEIIHDIPQDLRQRVFQDWKKRLQECLNSGGEYVE